MVNVVIVVSDVHAATTILIVIIFCTVLIADDDPVAGSSGLQKKHKPSPPPPPPQQQQQQPHLYTNRVLGPLVLSGRPAKSRTDGIRHPPTEDDPYIAKGRPPPRNPDFTSGVPQQQLRLKEEYKEKEKWRRAKEAENTWIETPPPNMRSDVPVVVSGIYPEHEHRPIKVEEGYTEAVSLEGNARPGWRMYKNAGVMPPQPGDTQATYSHDDPNSPKREWEDVDGRFERYRLLALDRRRHGEYKAGDSFFGESSDSDD